MKKVGELSGRPRNEGNHERISPSRIFMQTIAATAAQENGDRTLMDPPTNTQKNISAVATIEQEALARRSNGERVGDLIARAAGQMWFIGAHALWFGVWIAVNNGLLGGVRPFDPFPFPFLTFVVSLEAIFLSLFILMSQNRSSRQADARAHLDLQVNLLAEQEATKMLQMLQSLCRYHGLGDPQDLEVQQLQERTEPEALLRDLKESLPDNP